MKKQDIPMCGDLLLAEDPDAVFNAVMPILENLLNLAKESSSNGDMYFTLQAESYVLAFRAIAGAFSIRADSANEGFVSLYRLVEKQVHANIDAHARRFGAEMESGSSKYEELSSSVFLWEERT